MDRAAAHERELSRHGGTMTKREPTKAMLALKLRYLAQLAKKKKGH